MNYTYENEEIYVGGNQDIITAIDNKLSLLKQKHVQASGGSKTVIAENPLAKCNLSR